MQDLILKAREGHQKLLAMARKVSHARHQYETVREIALKMHIGAYTPQLKKEDEELDRLQTKTQIAISYLRDFRHRLSETERQAVYDQLMSLCPEHMSRIDW